MSTLNQTPAGSRLHISIFGRRNAGKSSLIAEINTISATSVKSATDAGEEIGELLPNIKQAAEYIRQIAKALNELSIGADQIAKGVSQIDTVVQANAATSEELASTSEELSAQAQKLLDGISFFKTITK